VEESVREYGKYLPLKSMVMFGGVGINPQIAALRKPVDILVATPGRLLDHVSQRTLDLSAVEILVLDEADRMLDMGFIHDIRKVLALLPAKRQNLLFSATFSDEIKTLADKLLDQPKLVEVARRNTTNELVDQRVHLVDRDKKTDLLIKLIRDHNWYQVLVFTRTKHGANRLAEKLDKIGIPAAAIHGNKSQNARTRALADFKNSTLQVLVATDIAARGLDIDQLPHVVNFELPNVPEDYVHRIGRTGRAGSPGEAVSLVCVDEFSFLRDIEKLTKQSIARFTVPGFEADLNVKPEPIPMGGNSGVVAARVVVAVKARAHARARVPASRVTSSKPSPPAMVIAARPALPRATSRQPLSRRARVSRRRPSRPAASNSNVAASLRARYRPCSRRASANWRLAAAPARCPCLLSTARDSYPHGLVAGPFFHHKQRHIPAGAGKSGTRLSVVKTPDTEQDMIAACAARWWRIARRMVWLGSCSAVLCGMPVPAHAQRSPLASGADGHCAQCG
jgi:ATP-dependent RNA helicase RhlE